MNPANNPNPEAEPLKKRPDPYFKLLTRNLMVLRGLLTGDISISQAMESDVLVIKPPGLDLQKTFLRFLLFHTVLEFKSQNDPFDWEEYCNAISRAFRYAAQSKIQPHQVLNLIVSARYPDGLIEYLAENGGKLKQPNKIKEPWLW